MTDDEIKFSQKLQEQVDLFFKYSVDSGEKYQLLGEQWASGEFNTLIFIFQNLSQNLPGTPVEFVWKSNGFFQKMLQTNLIKRPGCSTVFVTRLFWDIYKYWQKDPGRFTSNPPGFTIV